MENEGIKSVIESDIVMKLGGPGNDFKKVSYICPVCGNGDISYGSLEVEGEPEAYVVQTAFCNFCESAWHDVYGLEDNVITGLGPRVPEIEFQTDTWDPKNKKPFRALIDGRVEGESSEHYDEARREAIHGYLQRKNDEEEAELAEDPEEPTGLLLNKYKCTCGKFWADVYDCAVDTDCPECGLTITPYDSEEVKR